MKDAPDSAGASDATATATATATANANAGAGTDLRPGPEPRSAYRRFVPIGTRWGDNDVYGHINNVVYFSFFDTAVNACLIGAGALDIHTGPVIGLVVETHCNYFAPLAFPQRIEAGLRVARCGATSVRYEVALFAEGEATCAARGHFVHVYVDRATRRPTALPPALADAIAALRPA